MATYHHKPIKKFGLDGIINDDSSIARLKGEYIRLIVSEMRLSGYVPRFDIEPDFTIEYEHAKNYFKFQLTIYGVYTGRKQSEWILGIDGHKPIHIQENKLKEYSQEQV